MDSLRILTLHQSFHDDLKRLSDFSLGKKITIRKLDLSRGIVQAAYKAINQMEYEGNLIEFLHYVSMIFIQDKWMQGLNYISSRKVNTLVTFKNKDEELQCCLLELVETCVQFESDAKNMFRAISENPHCFFETEYYKEFRKRFQECDEVYLQSLCFRITAILSPHFFFGFEISSTIKNIHYELNKAVIGR